MFAISLLMGTGVSGVIVTYGSDRQALTNNSTIIERHTSGLETLKAKTAEHDTSIAVLQTTARTLQQQVSDNQATIVNQLKDVNKKLDAMMGYRHD